jgi:chemotaxis protein MotB
MPEQAPIIIKKKKVHGHGHHGGAWKVAFADFVTAMMAFFMVMWIVGMSEDVRMEIQGYFNDPMGFAKTAPKSNAIFTIPGLEKNKARNSMVDKDIEETRTKESQKIEGEVRKSLQTAGDLKELLKSVETQVTREGLRIELVENTGAVFFQSGSDQLSESARILIRRIGPILARTNRRVIIEGHTDAEPFPSQSYTNWDLSTDRALALRRALSAAGVPYRQFGGVRGLADTELKRPSDPLHFSNRRVSILLPFGKVGGAVIDLPKDQLKTRVDGVFRRPLEIAPAPFRVEGQKR